MPQNLVVRRPGREQLSALVGNGSRGLQQHQAVIGRRQIDASGREIIRQRADVQRSVIAAQRQLEAVLSFRRTVARPLIAAQAGQHRVYVPNEVRHVVACQFRRVDGYFDTLTRYVGHNLSRSRVARRKSPTGGHLPNVSFDSPGSQPSHIHTAAIGQRAREHDLRIIGRFVDHDAGRLGFQLR